MTFLADKSWINPTTAFTNDADSMEIIDTKLVNAYSPGEDVRPNATGFPGGSKPPVCDPGCSGRPYPWKNGSIFTPQRSTNKKWLERLAENVQDTADRTLHFLQFLWKRPLSRATPRSWRSAAPTINGLRPNEDESCIAGSPGDALASAKAISDKLLKDAREESLGMDWQAHYTRIQASGVLGALSASDLLNHEDAGGYEIGGDQVFTRFPIKGRESFWLKPEAEFIPETSTARNFRRYIQSCTTAL